MRRLLLVSLCLIAFSPCLFASGLVGFGFQLTGASANFAEPLKDVYGSGIGGGVHLDINFLPFIGVRVAGDYLSFSPDNDKYKTLFIREIQAETGITTVPSDWSVDGGRVGILSIAANAKLGLPTPVLSPYVTAGIGSSTMSVTDLKIAFRNTPITGLPSISSETKFSANLGVGAELNLVVSLYLEAKYTWIFVEGGTDTYVPVSLGITF